MDLRDVLTPNQYGTVPTLVTGNARRLRRVGDQMMIDTVHGVQSMPLSTEVVHDMRWGLRILGEQNNWVVSKLYIVPANSENFLIHNAIIGTKAFEGLACETHIKYMEFKGEFRPASYLDNGRYSFRVLDDGTGWIHVQGSSDDPIPATFYFDDILYRLDLQGKDT